MKNYLIGLFTILSIVIIYLIIYSGEKNIVTFYKLKKEVNENKKNINELKKNKEKLNSSIEKLKSNDLDYLDELARDKLDMSKPDEIIIFNKE